MRDLYQCNKQMSPLSLLPLDVAIFLTSVTVMRCVRFLRKAVLKIKKASGS